MDLKITTKNVDITQNVDKGSVWKQVFLSIVEPPFAGWGTTALIISAAVAAPLYSVLIDRCGRKLGFYSVIMLQGVSCIPLLLSPNMPTIIILHVVAGVTSGGLFTALPIYIRELSTDSIRGAMVSLMLLMTSAGYLVKLAMTNETLLYLMAGLVMFQFLSVFLIIESPGYLVMRDKMEAATKSLAKLKFVPNDNLYVIDEISKLKEESDRAKANGPLNIYSILKNKIYRDGTKVGIVLYTVTVLSGSIIFLDQEKTLEQLKTEADPEKLLVPIGLAAGGLTTVLFLRILERKYYLTFAYSSMVLSMGILAVYTQNDLTVKEFRMVPIVCLAILVFSYGMAWGVPVVIMVELLNVEIRATIMGALYAYYQILKLAHIHSYSFLKENIDIYTLLYIFTGVNLFGAVYTISKVPDIKMKTIRATIMGALYAYYQILKLAHIHSYSFLKENIGIYTLLYIFTGVNLFGAVYTISKVPDIKMKTIRATIMGALYAYYQILKLAHIHSYSFLKENIGIYTLLYIFTGVNLFGAVYTISKVPDIKMKTVRQIERQLKRIPILKM